MNYFYKKLSTMVILVIILPSISVATNTNSTTTPEAPESTKIFGYTKAMYVTDDKKGGRLNQSTPGFGGKIGIETGSYYGFKLKGAWYTTQDFNLRSENPKKTDAYMFNLNKKPYSLLGEVQVQFNTGKSSAIVGRQEISSPIIESYDYRIIPNLFEAYTVVNKDIDNTTMTLSYIKKMSGLDGLVSFSEFYSMSQQAYTSLITTQNDVIDAKNGDAIDISKIVGKKGVLMAGLVYKKDHTLQIWNYYGTDILNTIYFDGKFDINNKNIENNINKYFNKNISAIINAQAYFVNPVGRFKTYLMQHGLNADYALFGIKSTVTHQPSGWTGALAYNQFTGNKNTVTAYGNWGGYPEFVSIPYVYAENTQPSGVAHSRLKKATIMLDLHQYGLKNHSIMFGHARIDLDDSIISNSDIIVNSLLYRAKLTPQFSARFAIEHRKSGNPRYNNKFATIGLRYNF